MTLEQTILKRLHPHANSKRAEHDVGYLNSQFPTLGCSMPAIRSVAKQTWKELERTYSHAQIRKQASNVWNATRTHDVMMVCLLYFSNRKQENTLADWNVLKTWAQKIDNWAHSDELSDLYADMLDRYPKEIYPVLKQWNGDRQPWKRRLSLTSLLYYSAGRTHPLPASKILPLVKTRLADDHFYVQRAVGWTLRECGNLYPEQTERCIQRHARDLSSIAFTTATEKWSKTKKDALKHVRKQSRKS